MSAGLIQYTLKTRYTKITYVLDGEEQDLHLHKGYYGKDVPPVSFFDKTGSRRTGSLHCGSAIYRTGASDLGDDYNVLFDQAKKARR